MMYPDWCISHAPPPFGAPCPPAGVEPAELSTCTCVRMYGSYTPIPCALCLLPSLTFMHPMHAVVRWHPAAPSAQAVPRVRRRRPADPANHPQQRGVPHA